MDDSATLCSVATSVMLVGNSPPYEAPLSAEKFVHEPILVLTRRPDRRMYAARTDPRLSTLFDTEIAITANDGRYLGSFAYSALKNQKKPLSGRLLVDMTDANGVPHLTIDRGHGLIWDNALIYGYEENAG